MNDDSDVEIIYKILVVGEKAGKSSIIERYLNNNFSDDKFNTTQGIESFSKQINHEEFIIKLQIFDSSSDIQYRQILLNYLKDIQGVILVYDLTNEKFLDKFDEWWKMVKEYVQPSCIILVGNKLDITEIGHSDEIKNMSNKLGINYVETSAKKNENIKEMFEILTSSMFDYYGTVAIPEKKKKNSLSCKYESNKGGSSCSLQ